MAAALHLTACLRAIKAHEGGKVSIAWAKRRVREAAEARIQGSPDSSLLALVGKLERACGCGIVELAEVSETWEG